MVKDWEDWHGLRTKKLKKFRLNFSKYGDDDVAPLGWNQMIAVLPLCPPPFLAVFRYSVSVLICTGESPFWWRVPAEAKGTWRDVGHLS